MTPRVHDLDFEALRDPDRADEGRYRRACAAAHACLAPALRRYLWMASPASESGAADLDDVLQVVWARAFADASLWTDPDALPFRLARRAMNAAHNQRRGAARYQHALERYAADVAGGTASAEVGAGQAGAAGFDRAAAALERVVPRLSPLDRQILRLCVEEGRSAKAAAAELGVTPGAIDARKHRLRAKLRELMLGEGVREW